jgi:hypothetical protein
MTCCPCLYHWTSPRSWGVEICLHECFSRDRRVVLDRRSINAAANATRGSPVSRGPAACEFSAKRGIRKESGAASSRDQRGSERDQRSSCQSWPRCLRAQCQERHREGEWCWSVARPTRQRTRPEVVLSVVVPRFSSSVPRKKASCRVLLAPPLCSILCVNMGFPVCKHGFALLTRGFSV